tara:strand:- start:4 stop:255 length:252 start_codon:yes stop_codon:yes gene_type:complete
VEGPLLFIYIYLYILRKYKEYRLLLGLSANILIFLPSPLFVTISFKISDFSKNKKQDPHIFIQPFKNEKIKDLVTNFRGGGAD